MLWIYLQVIPSGGGKIKHHKVTAGLHIVGNQGPLLLFLWLVLHHKVDHWASTILPGIQVKGDTAGGNLKESSCVRN